MARPFAAILMGEAPPAFDLLYWNGDGTNLPGKMCVEYLRGLCQQDRFAAATFRICGEDVSLSDVKHPLFAVACETDHIAAWKSSFRGIAKDGQPRQKPSCARNPGILPESSTRLPRRNMAIMPGQR